LSVFPSARTTQALGVDIGNREMKLALLSQSGSTITVDTLKTVPLDPASVLDGVIQDRKDVALTLRSAMSGEDLRAISAVVSIPTSNATLRWVSLPQLPPHEHHVAASYKVKKHLPYPIEDAYLSTSPVQVLNEDGIGESLVISVPRHVIASRALAIERAGLRLAAAELEGQALLRVLERSLRHRSTLLRDASMTMIDIGGSNTEMYVVQNQKLQFLRSVRFGASRIARKVGLELGISEAIGHEMLANPESRVDADGVLTIPNSGFDIRVPITFELDVLLREIGRLMRYFRSLHAERSYAGVLDHMMLTGGIANLNGLDRYLEQNLKVRLVPLEPLAGTTLNVSKDAFALASQSQSTFAIAVGLALSQFDSQQFEEAEDDVNDFIWARSA
jgi:type IV pilus assembly protein PilM